MSDRPYWRLGLVLGSIACYAVASHWLMLHAASQPWAIVVLLGPVVLAGAGIALRHHRRLALAVCMSLGVGMLVLAVRGDIAGWLGAGTAQMDPSHLYVVQHAGIHLLLCAVFAASLRGPGLSLIGELAQRVHALTPDMVVYTRGVTMLWALYFFAMALASIAVFAWLPWQDWSLLANFGTPVAIVGIFLGEHFFRYLLHPEFERTSLMDAVRAWQRHTPET